jgi:hypothetical protein
MTGCFFQAFYKEGVVVFPSVSERRSEAEKAEERAMKRGGCVRRRKESPVVFRSLLATHPIEYRTSAVFPVAKQPCSSKKGCGELKEHTLSLLSRVFPGK